MSSCDLRSDRRGVGLFVEFMRKDIVLIRTKVFGCAFITLIFYIFAQYN